MVAWKLYFKCSCRSCKVVGSCSELEVVVKEVVSLKVFIG